MTPTIGPRGAVLVLNAGSSSLKFAVYRPSDPPARAFRGTVRGFGRPAGALIWAAADAGVSCDSFPAGRVTAAARFLDGLGQRAPLSALWAVGHWVVHGGPRFD